MVAVKKTFVQGEYDKEKYTHYYLSDEWDYNKPIDFKYFFGGVHLSSLIQAIKNLFEDTDKVYMIKLPKEYANKYGDPLWTVRNIGVLFNNFLNESLIGIYNGSKGISFIFIIDETILPIGNFYKLDVFKCDQYNFIKKEYVKEEVLCSFVVGKPIIT
jgi:hypothetical protein